MRCIRAVKALRAEEGSDLKVVALYTQVEQDAPFVRHADFAVLLPGEGVAAYLDHDALIAAVRAAGADAAWPGWGFVAEDPAFVQRLEGAGIVFLGPSAQAMRALGDKIGSKLLAEAAQVPVTPWSGDVVEDEAAAARCAKGIGFPLVVKASAGGGGRGIRVVEKSGELAEAFRSAASEARSAFGDGRLFIEQKVEGGRHIEVQIVADAHGNVHAVGSRDCSVQRRHQKVLEEGPPPGLPAGQLDAMKQAAVSIAERAGYTGVGTVEFLAEGDNYYFLEMNPRLQVEHGITEMLTGLDLVQLQIRVARGESLAALSVSESGHAMEARVCAEDPDQGFLPAPGRIARFDPALGPRIRVDTGVASGSVVPAAFDSLIAKVIAGGRSRSEARARLAAALHDFDLVIEGGASNKGYLGEILDHPDFRRGGVSTTWLDGVLKAREGAAAKFSAPALLAAAILVYQRNRKIARLNFFADASSISRVPAGSGQEVELSCAGEQYEMRVYALGSWRYRVYLDGQSALAALREESEYTARLQMQGRVLRVLYDIDDAGLRVEVEGAAYAFSSSSAGKVRAGAPAMIVALQVQVGDSVEAGQALGVLEAMKMEVGFEAPVSGVVSEICVNPGEQVAAGDVILVIDPKSDETSKSRTRRVALDDDDDPLAPLFSSSSFFGGTRKRVSEGRPDLAAAEKLAPPQRRAALDAVREETRRVLLGYDVNPERADRLADFMEAPPTGGLSAEFCSELAELRGELVLLADIARLFIRAPSASLSGDRGPSNEARLRMYVRRMHAAGAGIDEDFLDLVRTALAHYGIQDLSPGDALERAMMRLLASQNRPAYQGRLALAMVRRLAALAELGTPLAHDTGLERALEQISGMRGLLSNAVADAAVDARYEIFQRPGIEAQAERITQEVQTWLDAAELSITPPPAPVLAGLAGARRSVFDRVGAWLAEADPQRRAISLAAHLWRLYAPKAPSRWETLREAEPCLLRFEFPEGRTVLGAACAEADLAGALELLCSEVQPGDGSDAAEKAPSAFELFVPAPRQDAQQLAETVGALLSTVSAAQRPARVTLNLVCRKEEDDIHVTLRPAESGEGFARDTALHGLHPEAARRVDLARLAKFSLERLAAPEGLYCFYARAREEAADERIFVLGDMRSRSPDAGREADFHIDAFEHLFYEATRVLRGVLSARDPARRLQWNRIALYVAPEIFLDRKTTESLAARLAPATRHLGLEKVLVRIKILERAQPEHTGTETEIVFQTITGMHMTILTRTPQRRPLEPHSAYESKVVAARRRRVFYPYEIIRTLTGSGGATGAAVEPELPRGSFTEYDLDPDAETPRAVKVKGRPYGENRAGVVFGLISTPTEKVPEGMERVLVLSDPTRGMGALAAPECDRVTAALDLAEARGIPLEWVPVSSGARIAMDSGTENLDATARVVRRIIEFTQGGGVIHLVVSGVNVGAQSYWNALATMNMHSRGVLIMTQNASMVLTGRAALLASGSVAAESEAAIGGYERVMGPNGEAQYFADSLIDAFHILYEHYRYTYVAPGEAGPRNAVTRDSAQRKVLSEAAAPEDEFETIGDIFSKKKNPERKRPFGMRAVMKALIDQDGGALERWENWVGAQTAIVWDAHLGGRSICLVGMESRNLTRDGYRPHDGPDTWNGGTLFPQSSKKVARALNAASGNRPVVILANLSGFDGSPESMRKLQLEYGAEIARAVVNFRGPLLFLVVSRYHGGAYVVFSRELNADLRVAALEGSFASVIGGGPAATVVFTREVKSRTERDPRVQAHAVGFSATLAERQAYERVVSEVELEKQAEVAAEFDAIHSVERALEVGSLEKIVNPRELRAWLIAALEAQD